MLSVKLSLKLIAWPLRGSFPKLLPLASLSLSLSYRFCSHPIFFNRGKASSHGLLQDLSQLSFGPEFSQLLSQKINIHSSIHWAKPFNETVKRKKKGGGEGKGFSLNIFLPLNASITCWSVSRDIPLYPFARTLILSANSMRDLSGLKGFPTPERVTLSVTNPPPTAAEKGKHQAISYYLQNANGPSSLEAPYGKKNKNAKLQMSLVRFYFAQSEGKYWISPLI